MLHIEAAVWFIAAIQPEIPKFFDENKTKENAYG